MNTAANEAPLSETKTDDEVIACVKFALTQYGATAYESYQDFLADNRTFDPYWQAIVKNNVEDFVFGREVMIKVGRKDHSLPLELVRDLAFELDQAANRHASAAPSMAP